MKKGLSLKKKYEIAKTSDEKIEKLQKLASISFIYLGAELRKVKKEGLYKYLGESPEYETFDSYIASKNIDLRKAYYLMQIHRVFCEELKFKPEELGNIYWTVLRVLLPVIKPENSRQLVEKAKTLRRVDLEIELKQLKSGLDDLDKLEKHVHTWRKIIYWRCDECGERSKAEPKDGTIIK